MMESQANLQHSGDRYKITIAGTDLTFECGKDDVLGRAALRAGIDLPYECNMGGCGGCKIHLVSGDVHTVWPTAAGLTDRDRRKGQFLACQSRPLSDCSLSLRTVPAASIPPQLRPQCRTAQFRQKHILSANLAEFEFVTDDPAFFLPGQYALLGIPGLEGQRAYSMANAANQSGVWKFIIRRVGGGAATSVLYDSLKPGDRIALDAPYGRGYWRPTNRPTVCIAGGSGLAPMLAVADAAKADGSPVHFFFGVGDAADAAAASVLGPVGDFAAVNIVASNPNPSWTGQTGFIHDAVEQAIGEGQSSSYEYYLAGPAPMINAAMELLVIKRKVPYEQIHFDRFL